MSRCVFNQVLVLFAVAFCAGSALAQAEWPTLAGSSSRAGTGTFFPPSLAAPRWIATHDLLNRPITFDHHAGPVASGDRVIAVGRVAGQDHLLAFDWWTGGCLWATPIPSRAFNSWSTPAVDAANGTVLVASGAALSAFNLADGSFSWRTDFFLDVGNASPCVTGDLGPRDRVLITDYDPFGEGASLYCINVDPWDPVLNPWKPGEIVWQAPIGSASGATPAYSDGRAYVAVAGEFSIGPGRIHAFVVDQSAPAKPEWTFVNCQPSGFYGGVSVCDGPAGPRVYAASYEFFGGIHSANMVKLDGATGDLLWSVPCGRTSSVPVVLADGRIVLSSGVLGFGSAPEVAFFSDLGSHAMRLWSTALDTWIDVDQDGRLDIGEFMLAGGFSTQPIVTRGRIVVGSPPQNASLSSAYDALWVMNYLQFPWSNLFLVDFTFEGGNSAAMADGSLYTIFPGGLSAFGGPLSRFDVNGDGVVDIEDLYAWFAGQGMLDVDGDGDVDLDDAAALEAFLRGDGPDERGGGPKS
ncbi:MAG: PQQ-binding-like beta-propeller repeat protein [Phycisphaerales bacterium]|nr:PQQ-binding-like beta-propeller repeat protein [Phycisphaerales bacterium]